MSIFRNEDKTPVEWYDFLFAASSSVMGTDSDDYIKGSGRADSLFGLEGNDTLIGRNGADYLNGGLGNDLLTGGSGNDYLVGDLGDDTLQGGRGDDLLLGGEGADYLNGGKNNDTASYEGSLQSVIVGLTQADGSFVFTFGSDTYVFAATGDAAGDTLVNIENLTGTDFADALQGNALDNVLDGGLGDDYLEGGAGADTLIGGEGLDTAAYASSSEAVMIDFVNNTVSGGDAGGDVLISIEGFAGSQFDDFIIAGEEENYIDAGLGSDTVSYAESTAGVSIDLTSRVYSDVGSGGYAEGDDLLGVENIIGSDYDDFLGTDGLIESFDGGAGNDTISFSGAQSYVMVDLLTGDYSGVDAENITLTSVENITGSSYADVLYGDDGDNVINARGGVETAFQNNVTGNDIMTGRGGSDTFVFQDISNYNIITDFEVGVDKIDLNYDGLNDTGDIVLTSVNGGADTEITSTHMVNDSSGEVDTVLLQGVEVGELSDGDFVF